MFYADVHFVLMISLNYVFLILFLLFHTFNHITLSIGVYGLSLADAFSWVGSDIFIYEFILDLCVLVPRISLQIISCIY